MGPIEPDPADADAFGAGGEPDVLNRAGRAVEVGIGNRVAAEHLFAGLSVAADADAERRLADAFDLQVEVLAGAGGGIAGLGEAVPPGEGLHHRPPPLPPPDRKTP